MRVLTKEFARLARKYGLPDQTLMDVVDEADRGLVEADIGGGLIKQRIARPGEGKSGGYRVVIKYRRGSRAIFLHVFAKNAKANLSRAELEVYREFAKILDGLDDEDLRLLIERRGWRTI